MNKVQKFVLGGFTTVITSIILLTIGNNAFAVEYTNYTSEKYKIKFDYPSDWTVTEKISRFDSGPDINIESPTLSKGSFNIVYDDEDLITELGASDIETTTYSMLESETRGKYDIKIIEKPSFITIDNQKTGTYLITLEEKYEDFPIKRANQKWVTIVGDRFYLLSTMGSTNSFDNPENIEIRDHLLKSIKFLDVQTTGNSSSTSRFD
jgi:hypothetical protein